MLRIDIEAAIGALALRVDLSVDGETLALVGPNGSGKTSLLKLVLGALRPSEGRIALAGSALFDARAGVDLWPEERSVGYLPQDYGLFPHMTALGNVLFALGCSEPRAGRAARNRRARALLDELEVGHVAAHEAKQLSGGERQRVALARALATSPRALLLDEPLAALDAGTRPKVREFLAGYLGKLALPAIVVTHDAADAAALAR
jgi:molybdate transport system ATP-binding protein